MADPITVTSTSRRTAVADPVVLRATATTRLVFIPAIVENEVDPSASIRGIFQFERKSPNDAWEKIPTQPFSTLKAGEHMTLELKSGEVKKAPGGHRPTTGDLRGVRHTAR